MAVDEDMFAVAVYRVAAESGGLLEQRIVWTESAVDAYFVEIDDEHDVAACKFFFREKPVYAAREARRYIDIDFVVSAGCSGRKHKGERYEEQEGFSSSAHHYSCRERTALRADIRLHICRR